MAKTTPVKSTGLSGIVLSAVPDRLDLRDRPYMPPVGVIPEHSLEPKTRVPVQNQGQTNACTGFALSSVVYHLLHSAGHKPAECQVSPFMLYSMARRYDEFPGDPGIDTGSSTPLPLWATTVTASSSRTLGDPTGAPQAVLFCPTRTGSITPWTAGWRSSAW